MAYPPLTGCTVFNRELRQRWRKRRVRQPGDLAMTTTQMLNNTTVASGVARQPRRRSDAEATGLDTRELLAIGSGQDRRRWGLRAFPDGFRLFAPPEKGVII